MSDAKLSLKIGHIEFSGEGGEAWLTAQLEKFIASIPEVVRTTPHPGQSGSPGIADDQLGKKALGIYLKEKNATENQNNKFLATAIWLHAKGSTRIKTSDVTKALRENSQSRLGNPSQCLANNVTQGYCERDGGGFFVTEDGKASLK